MKLHWAYIKIVGFIYYKTPSTDSQVKIYYNITYK